MEAKAKKGVMKDKAANIQAGDEVGVSVPAMEEKMQEYIENMKVAFSQIHAGRVQPSQLDDVQVSAHGQNVPLKAIAQVSARNAQTLLIQLYDPSLFKSVDKALRGHSSELNPLQEDSGLVVQFPKMTKERRQELVKEASRRAEETRGHLRSIRQQYLQQLKSREKSKEMSKDLAADLKNQIQASHDVLNDAIKKMLAEKEKEIMQA